MASGTLTIPGHKLVRHDSIRGDAAVTCGDTAQTIRLPKHSLAILVSKNHR